MISHLLYAFVIASGSSSKDAMSISNGGGKIERSAQAKMCFVLAPPTGVTPDPSELTWTMKKVTSDGKEVKKADKRTRFFSLTPSLSTSNTPRIFQAVSKNEAELWVQKIENLTSGISSGVPLLPSISQLSLNILQQGFEGPHKGICHSQSQGHLLNPISENRVSSLSVNSAAEKSVTPFDKATTFFADDSTEVRSRADGEVKLRRSTSLCNYDQVELLGEAGVGDFFG